MKVIPSLLFAVSLLAVVSILSSCSASRQTARKVKKDAGSEYLLQQLARQSLRPDWFEAKTQINFSDEYQSMSASATIRMKMDSLLWVSVRKLGFELARVQVTRDSVYVLDRINNEYAIEGLEYLARSYGLPASLSQLQDFILGNAIFFSATGLKVENSGSAYRMSGQEGPVKADYWIDASGLLLRRMAFEDTANEQRMDVQLEDYGQTDDKKNFSYLRNLELDGRYTGKTSVAMKFSKVETNIPKDIRFEIPSKYTRAK